MVQTNHIFEFQNFQNVSLETLDSVPALLLRIRINNECLESLNCGFIGVSCDHLYT